MVIAPILAGANGCANKSESSGPPGKTSQASNTVGMGNGLNCELKGGKSPCTDDKAIAEQVKRRQAAEAMERRREDEANARKAEADRKAQQSKMQQFSPYMCKEGGGGFIGFWSSVATMRVGSLMEYCSELEDDLSRPANVEKAGSGGCVWKGKEYQVGESIRSQRDGRILSSDLFINGQSFDNFVNGAPGPWQGCDCGTSSGPHWGCV